MTGNTLIFSMSKGVFYSDVTNLPGGVNVGRLKNAPGGPFDLVLARADDPNMTPTLRTRIIEDGKLVSVAMKVGLFTDPHWYAGSIAMSSDVSMQHDLNGRVLPDPLLYRRQVTTDVLTKLAVGDPVVLDFEKTPRMWQQTFFVGSPTSSIAGWRGKQGIWWKYGSNMTRPTAASNEPHQDNPTDLYKQANVAYLPQLYSGNMDDYPAWLEAQWEIADGQDISESHPIFDAKDYDPLDMTPGTYLFDANRLAILTG